MKKYTSTVINMTLYLEKDPKFAYRSGYQKRCNLWSGWRKSYLKLDWKCNTRCRWVWLIPWQWAELPGTCLKCVHFVYFCVAGLRFLCLPSVSCSCAWANVKFVLCSACSLTYLLHWNKSSFLNKCYSVTNTYSYIYVYFYVHIHSLLSKIWKTVTWEDPFK